MNNPESLDGEIGTVENDGTPATTTNGFHLLSSSVYTPELIDNYTTYSDNSSAFTNFDAPDPYYFYETPQIIVLSILFFLIVVGNSSVIFALMKTKGRKSRMNFFIMHLAFADLLVGLVHVLIDIILRITITWHAGNIACKLVRYLQVLVTYSSTYVLVALSIDRYDAITRPMKFSGSWRRARMLIGSAWILSAIFSIPIPILCRVTEIEGRNQCWLHLENWQWKVYMTSVACAVFIIPALIIMACYAVILTTIWNKSSTIVTINPKSKRKTSRVFIICWSPYFVFNLLQVYDYIPETQTSIAIATFVQSLAPLNSAANPIIYCLFSTRICTTVWKFPPFKWIANWLSPCFPNLANGADNGFNGGCLRYGVETSTTCTETLTQSSRRSRLTSGPSLRQIVFFRLNSADSNSNKNLMKAEATIV